MSARLDAAHQRYQLRLDAHQLLLGNKLLPNRAYRYMESRKPWLSAGFTWDTKRRGFAFIERPGLIGLREVGTVIPEFRRSWEWRFEPTVKHPYTGWYLNPDGESWGNGDGLCWGVVLQLPGKNKRARLVAGYEIGEGGLTVDFTTIFEVEQQCDDDLKEADETIKCARAADRMAQEIAEEEREYQLEQRELEDNCDS